MVVLSVFSLKRSLNILQGNLSETDTAPCFDQQILHPNIYLVVLLTECSHLQAAVWMSCKAVNCSNELLFSFGLWLSVILLFHNSWFEKQCGNRSCTREFLLEF